MSQARETLPSSGSMSSTCWLTVGSAAERAFGTLAATWTGTAMVRKMGRFFEKWVTLLLCSIFLMKMDFGKMMGLLQD